MWLLLLLLLLLIVVVVVGGGIFVSIIVLLILLLLHKNIFYIPTFQISRIVANDELMTRIVLLLGAFPLVGLVWGGGRAAVGAAAIVEPPWRSSPPTVKTVPTMGTTVSVLPTGGLPTRPSHATLSPLSRVPSLLEGPSIVVCVCVCVCV
jgi:hypothetical protein